MIESSCMLDIEGLQIEVLRKPVKNFNLRVYPPEGKVKISIPWLTSEQALRQILTDKMDWIRRKQGAYQKHVDTSTRREGSNNSVYLFGKKLALTVNECAGQASIQQTTAELHVNLKSTASSLVLNKTLDYWYRQQLKDSIPVLLEKWEPLISVSINEWRIKKMKTRWGSCNIVAKRIWLNLELAKKPQVCLEYVLVHELTHLHERYHNARFKALLDSYLPNWRDTEALLNRSY